MNHPLSDLFNTVIHCLQSLVLRCTIRFKTQIKLSVISIQWALARSCSMISKSFDAHIINRISPRHNPWGSPQHKLNGLHIDPLMPTFCTLLWRYDSTHLRANSLCRSFVNVSWLTVSKAALRSNITSI